ncbi:MAG: DUF4105 domain-containing protein [Lentisphaerae bacterium]|nr:DUF4105 domain-containing protein [Lentisphaerota bacterium]MCP4102417.1 DUF4105 domain-containing protein [Lentisphaerota bacterium]
MFRLLFKTLYAICYLGVALWCFGAVWYSNLPFKWLQITTPVAFALLALFFFFLSFKRPKTGIPLGAGLFLTIIIWYLLIPASNNHDWQISCSRLPEAVFNGNKVTIKNIRDFKYRSTTDFDANYITSTYDLNKLKTLDLAVVQWDGNRAIAHTMLSFGFSDGKYLIVSAETRLKKDQRQSGIKGLYKQYGIIYILGTEEDLFRLRTNFRHEQLFLYATNTKPAEARIVLTNLLHRCNRLLAHPKFYNTITFNCTSSLIPSLSKIMHREKFDIRIYLNGYSDEMAFENGWLVHPANESFIKYQARHLANLYVQRYKGTTDYSRIIRTPFAKDFGK